MENFEIIKKNIIESIKNKINLSKKELVDLNPENDDYNNILTELTLLKLELDEANKLEEKNIDGKLNELDRIKEKYLFLKKLSPKEINVLLNLIKNYRINIDFDLSKSTSFPEILSDYEKELLLNGINCLKFNNSEEINKSIEIINQKTEEFKKNKLEFRKLLNNFDGFNFMLLRRDIENGRMPSIERLTKFNDLGQDSLIAAIIEKYKQKLDLKKEVFITKTKREEKEKAINDKIIKYLNDLIKNIEFHIRNTYLLYKQKFNLPIEEYKIEKVEDLYSEIIYRLEEKELESKKINTKYQTLYMLFVGLERTIQKELSKIGINIESLKTEKDIDIFKIDRDFIYELISKIRLDEEIKLSIEKINKKEEGPKLSKVSEEQ